MSVIDTFTQRNAAFSSSKSFSPDLKIMPSMKTLIIGCVDPRVDPSDILGLALGEAAVIRNVGGRITPEVLETMAMLRVVSKAGGGELGSAGWNLIVLHHTDCGIKSLAHSPDLLGKFFRVPPTEFAELGEHDTRGILDPHVSVAYDVAALKKNPLLPAGFLVTGLVYDVKSGTIETEVAPALLRTE